MSGSTSDRGGLSVRTLAIASAASALATYVVPMIWRPGTIAAAAATPVIVALISEALSRPAEHVSQAGRLVRVPRSRFSLRGLDQVGKRRLKLAVGTGLLAFLVAAVVITATELAAGEAVSSPQRTTLLGGKPEPKRERDEATPATAPEATPEVSPTPAGPDETVVPGGEASPTPAPPTEGTPTPLPVAPEPTPAAPPPAAPQAPQPTPAPVTP